MEVVGMCVRVLVVLGWSSVDVCAATIGADCDESVDAAAATEDDIIGMKSVSVVEAATSGSRVIRV